jgi:simple sugar transport system ATP-binding protein
VSGARRIGLAGAMEQAPHILVVDDHRDIRDLLARYLVKHGLRASVAESAAAARKLIQAAQIVETLSGGNVQRVVLARELSDEVEISIVANPCFGLDFAATTEIRSRIVEARNRGAAVLLISEDLDEIFELADRVLVMFDGRIAYEADSSSIDREEIGRHMAGH